MKYWFKRKRYGYGWVPCSWEGWLFISVAVISISLCTTFLFSRYEEPTAEMWAIYWGVLIAHFVVMLAVTYMKGPKPKWRWGISETDNPEEDF